MNVDAWIAFSGVALLTVINIATVAFLMGGLFARVRRLEDDRNASATLTVQVAALAATTDQFERKFEQFDERLAQFNDTVGQLVAALLHGRRSGRRGPPAAP